MGSCMFTELQKDLLGEILNTNIGVAASLLSEMVNQKILLSVPELDLKSSSELNFADIGGFMLNSQTSVLSSMKFGKQFSGSAYLIFPAEHAKNLVMACTEPDTLYTQADDLYTESEYTKLTVEDLDVLKEISSIILNSVIGEFAKMLKLELEYTLPQVKLTIIENVERTLFPDDLEFLMLYTSFSLSKSDLKGMLFIVFLRDSVQMLTDKMNGMLVDVDG